MRLIEGLLLNFSRRHFSARISVVHQRSGVLLLGLLAVSMGFSARVCGQAPAPTQTPAKDSPQAPIPQNQNSGATPAASGLGQKTAPAKAGDKPADAKSGTDDKSASKPASAGEQSASTTRLKLGPLDPSTAPTDLPKDRPVIGLALGGGGAIAMSEIGVIQWFEEHHIPVDVIAGTSMGSILAALYSTGHTPDQMRHIMTEDSVNSVFRISSAYTAQSFRRREDSRDIPNSITVGLKHGAALRNSLLTDTGLNELLDKEFLRYNDQTDFNNLPIPFRCQATDLNAAKTVTFSRGSLQDAVRASASIPGVFRPFQLDGHEFVDGAILENLPTADVKAMHADVILAVSLRLEPVGKGDLDSILGVLQRAFAVGIEANEARDRKLANVVVIPDVTGFTASDYLKTADLAKRGYDAAEANKAALLPYAISDSQWQEYLDHRASKQFGKPGTILFVKIKAPEKSVEQYAQRLLAPIVNQPFDTDQIEKLLSQLRADGRYDVDYTVGYDQQQTQYDPGLRRPIVLVTVTDKKTGPPFLDVGLNIAAQTGGVTRATINNILLFQDLGGYGSEGRAKIDFGFYTRFEGEYYRKLTNSGFFAAPKMGITRTPYYIYSGNTRLAERQSQFFGPALDLGWSNGSTQELRAGWDFQRVSWTLSTGDDALPDFHGNAQTARVQYIFDSQDRALVPQYGMRIVTDLGYLYDTPNSPNAPQLSSQLEFAHTFGRKNTFLTNAEGGTMFNRDVAQPFRYTLGGPLRLAASAIDQYRGTDYFLVTPGYLRQIKSLPAPLGNALYLGGAFEVGQMRAPDGPTATRYDVYFGVVAETPFGVISVAPAFGNAGERKLVFTIGRLF
jgi:NTE family protein